MGARRVCHAGRALKRLGKDDTPSYVNQFARDLVRLTTEERDQTISSSTRSEQLPAKSEAAPAKVTRSEISRVMAAMGSKGGTVGVMSRMVKITPRERSRIALSARRARNVLPCPSKYAKTAIPGKVYPAQVLTFLLRLVGIVRRWYRLGRRRARLFADRRKPSIPVIADNRAVLKNAVLVRCCQRHCGPCRLRTHARNLPCRKFCAHAIWSRVFGTGIHAKCLAGSAA